jgi:hypothetical protein
MQVDVLRTAHGFHYRLTCDPDDPDEFGQALNPTRRFRRVGDTWDVRLPVPESGLHPDAHAAALWLQLAPLTGSTLRLPFGVSATYADRLAARYGVHLPNVDGTLAPPSADRARPALLFSGGVDSLAAALVMPRDTAVLLLDRIPHFPPGQDARNQERLIDPVMPRQLAAALGRAGHDVHVTASDHDHLYAPYPFYHSGEFYLPALYLAGALGCGTVSRGDVLCALALGGYHDGRDEWRFRPEALRPDAPASAATEAASTRPPPEPWGDLAAVGLGYRMPLLGLTEVGTARVVSASPFRGRATSCYYPSHSNYCLRCDKCFKKLLLEYVIGDEEVPAALVEHFLEFPYLEQIFARPYFDWHHVWYYIFQRVRCRHPLALELRRQAREGPDLALFEKWYPISEEGLPDAWRDELLTNIHRVAPRMPPSEAARMDALVIPPLHVPPDLLARAARAVHGAASAPATDEPEAPPEWRRPFETAPAPDALARALDGLLRAAAALGLVASDAAPVSLEPGGGALRLVVGTRDAVVMDLVAQTGSGEAVAWDVLPQPPVGDAERWVRVVRTVSAWLDRRRHDHGAFEEAHLRSAAQPNDLQRRAERAVFLAAGGSTPPPWRGAWPVPTRDGGVRVALHGPDGLLLDLQLHERQPGARCFRSTERTAVSHAPATPVDTPARAAALRRLLAALERTDGRAIRPPDRTPRNLAGEGTG